MIFVNLIQTSLSCFHQIDLWACQPGMFLISGWCGHSPLWEVPPWIGGPELLNKVSRACCGKQARKHCSCMASVSVSAFRLLPWFPLMINYHHKLKYPPNYFDSVFYHSNRKISRIEGKHEAITWKLACCRIWTICLKQFLYGHLQSSKCW